MGPVLPRDRQLRRHRACAGAWRRPGARARAEVRLWIDDASALRLDGAAGRTGRARSSPGPTGAEPGDVVIEAFGCDPPAAYVDAMTRRAPPPVWINLEYLSAEAYVERTHGLPSPQRMARRARLDKWFFYPGFTRGHRRPAARAGLLDARQLRPRRLAGARRPGAAAPGERVVSLFCYANAPLPALLQTRWPRTPTLLLLRPGRRSACRRGRCRAAPGLLPWLEPARLRPPAVGLRPELRARRGLVRARAMGRRAVRLADLPAARRRARGQAGGLPRPHAGRPRRRRRCAALAGLERLGPGRRLAAACPARPWQAAPRLARSDCSRSTTWPRNCSAS